MRTNTDATNRGVSGDEFGAISNPGEVRGSADPAATSHPETPDSDSGAAPGVIDPARHPRRWSSVATGVTLRLRGAIGFLIVIAVWYLTTLLQIVPPNLLPMPHEVVAEAISSGGEALGIDILASVERVTLGLLIGVAIAVPVGFLFAQISWISALFSPVINFARALPPIALIPLVVVYFGIGEGARLLVLVAAAFFPAMVVIFEYVTGLDPIYTRAGQTLGSRGIENFYRITFPLALPAIFTALRVSLAITWATVVAAELIAAQRGLGAYIQDASNFFRIAEIIAGILLIGTLAVIMDRILQFIQKRLLRWQ